jgi:hypothetical protein
VSARIRNRDEFWTGRTARRRHRCESSAERCKARFIEPGDRYIEITLPPRNAEVCNDGWERVKACLACASQFNAHLVAQVFPAEGGAE